PVARSTLQVHNQRIALPVLRERGGGSAVCTRYRELLHRLRRRGGLLAPGHVAARCQREQTERGKEKPGLRHRQKLRKADCCVPYANCARDDIVWPRYTPSTFVNGSMKTATC